MTEIQPSGTMLVDNHVLFRLTADLMATKAQLLNQKFVCVLEACPLGRNRLELVLSRAFPLQS